MTTVVLVILYRYMLFKALSILFTSTCIEHFWRDCDFVKKFPHCYVSVHFSRLCYHNTPLILFTVGIVCGGSYNIYMDTS